MKLEYTIAALALSAIVTHAAPIFSEDFNALTPASSLSGQGSWTGPAGPQVVEDPGTGAEYYGFSGNLVEYSEVDALELHPVSGLNNTEVVTMEMDLRISGDTSYTYWALGKSQLSLGVERGNLTLRGADGGTKTYTHNLTGDKNYHLSMTILPTAFSGAGSATVTLAEWIDESTVGPKTTAFSNVKLILDDAGKALSDNIGTSLRMSNAGTPARADNLTLTQGEGALVEMTAASPQKFNNNGSNQIHQVAFTNIGTDVGDPLDITGVTLSGPDAGLFTSPTVWTTSVAANGGTGTIDLPFVPAGALPGTYLVTLEVTSDAESSPVTIQVEVEVKDPIAVVSPSVLNFGNLPANPGPQTLTVNITNSGGSKDLNIYSVGVFNETTTGTFTVGSYPATLSPGANTDVMITFDPGSNEGIFSGTLEINTDGSNQYLFTLALSALVATGTPVPVFTEDFNSLQTGISLSGQGGWGGPTSVKVVTNPGYFGFSGNFAENSSADNQENHPISGLNDVGLMTMEFDLRISGDLSYTYWILGQSGVSIGVERGNMTLRGAAAGTQNFDHNLTGDNVYHMAMTVDPKAFGGAGSATVTYAKYTAQSTLDAPQTAFSGVELNLKSAGKKLSQNTNFVLRLANVAAAAARADNLKIAQVPKPTYQVEITAKSPQSFTNYGMPQTMQIDFSNIGVDNGQTLNISSVTLSGADASFFTVPTVWTAGVAANGGTGTINLPFDSADDGNGTYIAALEVVSDAANSPYTINVQVQVKTPPPYVSWALNYPGLTDTNPKLDFDNDGLMTGIEWVVGGDPTANDAAMLMPTLNTGSDPNNILYTYRRSAEAGSDANTIILVEYGSNLIGWRNTIDHGAEDGVTSTEEYEIEPGIDAVTIAIPKSLGSASGKLFVRLKVTIAP